MKYLFFLTPIIGTILTAACMKAPSTVIQKGPTTACSSIDDAVATTQHANILNIQPGEFASTDTFTMVDGPYESLSEQEAVTVVARAQTTSEIDLTIQDELNENVDGTFKTSTKQGTAVILLDSGTSAAAAKSVSKQRITNNSARTDAIKLAQKAFTISAERKAMGILARPTSAEIAKPTSMDTSIQSMSKFQNGMQVRAQDVSQGSFCEAQAQGVVNSYHNLTTQASTMEIPSAVKARADCGGVANCQGTISTQILQFDRWVDDPNNPGQEMKVTTYIVTSPEVPFFASVLSQCMQYSWPTAAISTTVDPSQVGQFVLITTCSNVSDFTYGKATP